jgi:2-polyprenyl-3-methyl-5-hydroxy-6-metoxy-1,4-benzoquinol methylase
MSPSLLQAERATYAQMWALDAYATHAPGERYLPIFLDMAHPGAGAAVLDAGTGSGKGGLALQQAGFDVRLCDLTPAGLVDEARALPFFEQVLWEPLALRRYLFGRKVDWVYCTDVLEHIPTAFTMLVVSRLLEVARHGVFLSVSLQPDVFGAWVGTALHQTVQPFLWWKTQLEAVGRVVEARDLLGNAVFLVTR